MSFLRYKSHIEEGDVAILYINPRKMHAIEVKSKIINRKQEEIDNVFQTQYGSLHVHSLVGKKYGSKVTLSKGWAHILYPTCELWTLTLPHRTQIIYTPDISMILFQLELRPGSVICEAGTGSGSLTHALARAVRPHGRVYSFDFHEQRVLTARKEFENHSLSPLVSVQLRDVCTDGYGDEMESIVDAVFLDLPLPWLAIPHAMKCLKNSGGRLASFSPCIEQVQKTSESLRTNGFTELQTVECLQREYSVGYRKQSTLSLDMVFRNNRVVFRIERSVRSMTGMEDLDFRIKGVKNTVHYEKTPPYSLWNRYKVSVHHHSPGHHWLFQSRPGEFESWHFNQKIYLSAVESDRVAKALVLACAVFENRFVNQALETTAKKETDSEDEKFLAALPPQSMPGHTGYLTFATLPPVDCRKTCSLLISATEENSVDEIESESLSLDLT